MNQKERVLITLIALFEEEKNLAPDYVVEKIRTIIDSGLKRPEKVLLNQEQQKRFWELVEEYRRLGKIE